MDEDFEMEYEMNKVGYCCFGVILIIIGFIMLLYILSYIISPKTQFYKDFNYSDTKYLSLSTFIPFIFLALYVKWIAWEYFKRN